MLGSMAIASIWTSMANWSTPTILFCLLNLMIAIIFLASNSNKSPDNHRNNSPNQLGRSPSLLERVQSVNLSSFYGSTTPDSHDHYGSQYETTGYNSASQLSRPPSLLQRVKSIDFSFSSFYATPLESEQTHHDSPSQLARVPSLLERVKSIRFSSYNPVPAESEQLCGSTSEPARVPSLLDGDKFTNQDQESDVDMDPLHDDPIKIMDEGSSIVKGGEWSESTRVRKSVRNLAKSRSEKRMVESDDSEEERRPATMKAESGSHDECVDAKADDFIKRFKQQLKLQRIDSLKRFREMLNRGI